MRIVANTIIQDYNNTTYIVAEVYEHGIELAEDGGTSFTWTELEELLQLITKLRAESCREGSGVNMT